MLFPETDSWGFGPSPNAKTRAALVPCIYITQEEPEKSREEGLEVTRSSNASSCSRPRFSEAPFWTEALLLKLVKVLYTHRLKRLLELLPEDMVAEILAEQDENGVLVPFSSN